MTPNPQRPTEPQAPLTAGEVLALGDDHRRGLHTVQANPRCSSCLVERLGLATDPHPVGTPEESS